MANYPFALAISCILLASVGFAEEWLPGYRNETPWAKTQLAEMAQDARPIPGKPSADGRNARLVFVGDSITYGWRSEPQHQLWLSSFGPWNPVNLGIGSDTAEDMRWRLINGPRFDLEPAGLAPKVVVVMGGTNNLNGDPQQRCAAVGAVVTEAQRRWPAASILLMSITPRLKPGDQLHDSLQATNPLLQKLADGKRIIWLDLNARMTWDGKSHLGISEDWVHFNSQGYQMWADILMPHLKRLLH